MPRAGRDQPAELAMERVGWADRVQLPANPARRGQASELSALAKARHAAKAS